MPKSTFVDIPPELNGPWQYKLSALYYELTVTAALASMTMEQTLAAAG
jgi:hypothetical protein